MQSLGIDNLPIRRGAWSPLPPQFWQTVRMGGPGVLLLMSQTTVGGRATFSSRFVVNGEPVAASASTSQGTPYVGHFGLYAMAVEAGEYHVNAEVRSSLDVTVTATDDWNTASITVAAFEGAKLTTARLQEPVITDGKDKYADFPGLQADFSVPSSASRSSVCLFVSCISAEANSHLCTHCELDGEEVPGSRFISQQRWCNTTLAMAEVPVGKHRASMVYRSPYGCPFEPTDRVDLQVIVLPSGAARIVKQHAPRSLPPTVSTNRWSVSKPLTAETRAECRTPYIACLQLAMPGIESHIVSQLGVNYGNAKFIDRVHGSRSIVGNKKYWWVLAAPWSDRLYPDATFVPGA